MQTYSQTSLSIRSQERTALNGSKRPNPANSGMALVLVLVIMVILSMIIAGLNRDVRLDLDITRNIRQKDEAFNWAESSLELTEETIASLAEIGAASNSTVNTSLDYGSSSFIVTSALKSGEIRTWGNRTLTLQEGSAVLANTDVQCLGARQQEGGSIIIAAGYEGAGKGAVSGSGVALYYLIDANGTVRNGNGRQRIKEIYRYVGK